MSSLVDQALPLVETTRGGLLECVHLGALVVADAHGSVLRSLGDPELLNFPRSSLKPFQLASLVRLGGVERFGFTQAEVAVMASSHSGEASHVETVASILRKIEAPPEVLRCGAHLPIDPDSALALQRSGREPTALHNNCSGKHVGMLSLARLLDAPLEGYLDPQHPAQRQIRGAIVQILELDEAALRWGTDGCSAPAYAVPLRNMALGYARLTAPAGVLAEWQPALCEIADAMRAHPALVGGSVGRVDTELMRLDAGLVAKGGAAGYLTVAHPVGHGLALKILDGDESDRARDVAVVEALLRLGWIQPRHLDGALGGYGPIVPVPQLGRAGGWRGPPERRLRVPASRHARGRDRAVKHHAGLGHLVPRLQALLHVPLRDPNSAGLKLAETPVGLGLSHRKAGLYADQPREPGT